MVVAVKVVVGETVLWTVCLEIDNRATAGADKFGFGVVNLEIGRNRDHRTATLVQDRAGGRYSNLGSKINISTIHQSKQNRLIDSHRSYPLSIGERVIVRQQDTSV